MAKVFRTETLSLSDNIRLASSEAGAFEITNAGGSTLMSKATIESDISSLQAQRGVDEGTTDSDVSSLAGDISTNKGELESDVSSLQAQRGVDEGTTDSDVSSLAGDISTNKGELESDVSSLQDLAQGNTADLESDVSSLAGIIATNDVVAKSSAVTNGSDSSGSIAFGRTFASTPVVVALLKSSNASDPIIACMVSSVSATAATVTFADSVPSANYTVELIASIAG